jgi:uncharacterized protein (TIGR01370 family)
MEMNLSRGSLSACVALVTLALASPAQAAPRNPKLKDVHDFAFAIGDGGLSGDVASRYAPYDLVVVDGELATRRQVRRMRARGTMVLAYLDVGTIESYRWWYPAAKPYRMELWGDWGEWYARVSAQGFRDLIAARVAPTMLDKGFDGLFLDNVDMIETHPAQAQGMRWLLRRVARRTHRRGGVVFAQNGAEIIGPSLPALDGWNREDVTSTYDFDSSSYRRLSTADTDQAQAELRRISAAGLLVTATDYTRAGDAPTRRAAVGNACAAGALPFVSDIYLTRIPAQPLRCP